MNICIPGCTFLVLSNNFLRRLQNCRIAVGCYIHPFGSCSRFPIVQFGSWCYGKSLNKAFVVKCCPLSLRLYFYVPIVNHTFVLYCITRWTSFGIAIRGLFGVTITVSSTIRRSRIIAHSRSCCSSTTACFRTSRPATPLIPLTIDRAVVDWIQNWKLSKNSFS